MKDIPKYLYRYRPAKRFLQELAGDAHTIYFSSFSELNDPMEGIYYPTRPNDFDMRRENFKSGIYENKMALGICCLTTRFDNMPMWSHYAGGGTGYCIEYDVEQLIASVSPIEFADFIEYVDDLQLPDIGGPYSEIALGILTRKLRGWSYENEFRIIKKLRAYYPNPTDQVITVRKSAISRIILGPESESSVHYADLTRSKFSRLRRAGNQMELQNL